MPQWVYALLFFASLGVGIGCAYAGPHGTVLIPAWSIISLHKCVSFSSSKPSDYLNMEPSSVLSALIAVVLGFSEYTYFFSMLDQIIDTVWQSPQRLVCDDKIPDALFSDSPI